MATAVETHESRKRRGGTSLQALERQFIVYGVTDNGESALAVVLAECPDSESGLLRDDDNLTLEPITADIWEAKVPYSQPPGGSEPEQPPPSTVEEGEIVDFDGTGGTFHLTEAIEQQHFDRGDAAGFAPGLAVNVGKDSVEGVDVVVPKLEFGVRLKDLPLMTHAKLRMLGDLTGKTNNATFLGFGEEEVLFLGPRGTITTNGRTTITLHFAVERTQTNIDIDGINVAEKKGWRYLWVRYKEDVGGHRKTLKPDIAFLAKIYNTDDFSKLNQLFQA